MDFPIERSLALTEPLVQRVCNLIGGWWRRMEGAPYWREDSVQSKRGWGGCEVEVPRDGAVLGESVRSTLYEWRDQGEGFFQQGEKAFRSIVSIFPFASSVATQSPLPNYLRWEFKKRGVSNLRNYLPQDGVGGFKRGQVF